MKISIIIPIYNVEKYLHQCLNSVLCQSYQDWECICINDGSPDNCEKIIQEFIKKDKRFFSIKQENQGLSVARNNGIKQASGNYIMFIDSDDFIHPQSLTILSDIIIKTKTDIIEFDYKKFTNNNIEYKMIKNISYKKYENPIKLLTDKKIKSNVWSKIYKAKILNNVEFIKGINFEDLPFNIEVLHKCKSIIITNEILYFYRKNPTSIIHSSFTIEKIKNYIKVINYIYEFISKNDPKNLELIKEKILNERIKMIMNSSIKKQKDKEIRYDLFKFMRMSFGILYKQGKISFKGLKLKHKISLFLILKGKLKTAILWGRI